MKWYAPRTWPKGLRIVAGILAVGMILFIIVNAGREDTAADTGYGGRSSTSKSSYNAEAAAEAPAPSTEPQAYQKDQSLGNTSDKDIEVEFSESWTTADGAFPMDRKIIKDGHTRIETKEFDRSLSAIDQIITQSGGFAERRTVRGNSINRSDLRYATIVFRVPSDRFESIMQSMGDVGTVVESNTNGTDITDQYIDMEARLKTLKIQEKTLQDIMAKAEKLEDVITLESRIAEVRYEIEKIENQLKNYDRLVQYSRISVDLNEVVEVTEKKPIPRTLSDKISDAFNSAITDFVDGLEAFTIGIVENWITFAFFLLVILIILIVIRKASKKRLKMAAKAEDGDKA